jgi:SulP family sulfate permease
MFFGFRVPIVEWLPSYKLPWLQADFVAGTTLAAYAVPVSLAYASLAGLPPQMGLYAYLAGGFGYAVFGSSKHVAVGPTSAISLLLGVSLVELVGTDKARIAELASLTALLMAGVIVLAWLLRLSVLVNFISESILTGFKAGAAIVIGVTQLPKLLGVAGGGDDFFERIWLIAAQLRSTQSVALSVGAAAIALLLLGERLLPRRPIALGVVLISLVVVALLQLEQRGLKVVGEIPAGLPGFGLSSIDLNSFTNMEVRQLIRLAGACFLLSYIESVSAARTFAMKHHYDVDSRQELLGLGAASLLASLFQGYPIASGLSQSAVNERAGAKTPLSLVFASLVIGCVLLFLTGFFRALPDAVLAAVVLVAISGLIDVREVRHLWRVSRQDFFAAAVAFVGVLCMGVLDGVVIAVIASLAMLLWRGSKPYVAFLGRIPGTQRYSDMARHPSNEALDGVLAFRVQASLLYFNADQVRVLVLERARGQAGLRRVIADLSNVPYVDVSGARMLRRLCQELKELNVELRVAEAHGSVRELLRHEGLEESFGSITRHTSLAEVIEDTTLIATAP